MSKTGRFVDWALRHGRALWILALLLAIPAALRTGWLYAHLRSDLEELLPRESPSVVALEELKLRLGGRQFMPADRLGPLAEHFALFAGKTY